MAAFDLSGGTDEHGNPIVVGYQKLGVNNVRWYVQKRNTENICIYHVNISSQVVVGPTRVGDHCHSSMFLRTPFFVFGMGVPER